MFIKYFAKGELPSFTASISKHSPFYRIWFLKINDVKYIVWLVKLFILEIGVGGDEGHAQFDVLVFVADHEEVVSIFIEFF